MATVPAPPAGDPGPEPPTHLQTQELGVVAQAGAEDGVEAAVGLVVVVVVLVQDGQVHQGVDVNRGAGADALEELDGLGALSPEQRARLVDRGDDVGVDRAHLDAGPVQLVDAIRSDDVAHRAYLRGFVVGQDSSVE